MSHTSGPWRADRVHPQWPECPVRYVDAGSFHEVATLYGGGDKNAAEITTANSRLIAAAPDLLAALLNCVKAQDGTGGTKGSMELAATEGARKLLRELGAIK